MLVRVEIVRHARGGHRIEVAERLVNVDSQQLDRIPLDEPEADRDVSEEIAEYFSTSLPEIEAFVNSK